MAKKAKMPRPTEAELAILQVLWKRRGATVREVAEELRGERSAGYTTILKLMQIMFEKGLVKRDDSQRTHIYQAAAPKTKTQRQLVADLLKRAFAGSAEQLVLQALSAKKASAAELAEIRKIIEQMEEKQR